MDHQTYAIISAFWLAECQFIPTVQKHEFESAKVWNWKWSWHFFNSLWANVYANFRRSNIKLALSSNEVIVSRACEKQRDRNYCMHIINKKSHDFSCNVIFEKFTCAHLYSKLHSRSCDYLYKLYIQFYYLISANTSNCYCDSKLYLTCELHQIHAHGPFQSRFERSTR